MGTRSRPHSPARENSRTDQFDLHGAYADLAAAEGSDCVVRRDGAGSLTVICVGLVMAAMSRTVPKPIHSMRRRQHQLMQNRDAPRHWPPAAGAPLGEQVLAVPE
jgi:hypothetical protein